jgi:hypothetical protein
METRIDIPLPIAEATVPLHICVAPFLEALHVACPTVPMKVQVMEFAIVLSMENMNITCLRHCADPSHACILVSIDTTIVHVLEDEKTPAYIQRVVQIIVIQLNWKQMLHLFETLPPFVSFEVVNDQARFQAKVVAPGLDETATIQGGDLVHCGIPLRPNGSQNLALMNQFLMMFPPQPEETFYVQILSTKNGFIGLHNYEGQRKVLSLSNYQGISTKFVIKGINLWDLENFLKKPTKEIVVIYTTDTPYSGEVGHLEFSCANFAAIRVDKEIRNIPTGQWAFLQIILQLF